MRGKRQISAYLVEPFKQIRFGLHVTAVCLISVILLSYVFVNSFYEQYQHVAEIFKVAEVDDLVVNDVFVRNAWKLGFVLLGMVAATVGVVVWRTHKMYGPVVSIQRFLKELHRGNYAVRLSIRQRDDFKNVVESLNQLASELQHKHGSIKVTAAPHSGLDALSDRLDDYENGIITVADDESKNKAS